MLGTDPTTRSDGAGTDPAAVRRPSRVTWMVVANVGLLLVGFGLQLLVYGRGGHSSLSDLPHVLLHRAIAPGAPPYLDRMLEYPVGAGMLLYLAALIRPTPLGVLTVTALAAGGLSVWITVALERRAGAPRVALGARHAGAALRLPELGHVRDRDAARWPPALRARAATARRVPCSVSVPR